MYITGSKKIQDKLWDKATDIMKYANENDISKKELVKLLLEVWATDRFWRFIILILLAISVACNILQFIFYINL